MARLTNARIEAALEHGVDIAGRRIFLHGGVEEATVGRAIRGLYLLADVNKEPIELYVSSYGGDLDEAFALHDVTRTISAPVHTVALGKCQSAAPLLVACGEKGYRYASENVTFMLHDVALSDVPENIPPLYLKSLAEAAKVQMATYARLLAAYTKKPAPHWARIFAGKSDKYFTAELAVAWGLVDQIWDEKG
jgi:ATP-dependent Clp protease protease subunit